jgi:hypothetical protein
MTETKRPYGAGLTPMARGRKKLAPRYAEEAPARRNPVAESALCLAIRHQVLVELRHGDDFQPRAFAPYVVYRTSKRVVCAFGMQVSPSVPSERSDPHNLEVGMIRQVELTSTHFDPDPNFDLSSARYRDRICPA